MIFPLCCVTSFCLQLLKTCRPWIDHGSYSKWSSQTSFQVSWRGEPWWTARWPQAFWARRHGSLRWTGWNWRNWAAESRWKQWIWHILTCWTTTFWVTFPGWNLPVNALLVSKRWSMVKQLPAFVPWSSFFFAQKINESHRESHRESQKKSQKKSQQISGGFAAGLGRRKNWFYGKLWRAPAQQCHAEGLGLWSFGDLGEDLFWKVRKT